MNFRMRTLGLTIIALTIALILLHSPNAQQEARPRAFPSAEGFGAFSQGGRGGEVYSVTTLEDGGPGSLRHAIEQEGPRTVVFAVSGTIRLTKDLEIKNPFITIAGQTAPGAGIALRGAALEIQTHDVIVRFLRVRLGDQGKGGDAININQGKNIIVDHCSASWSTDEVLSTSTDEPDLTDVTVQWCFITEALNPENHSFGSLIRGTGGARYSYHHNLYAHNRNRNPRPGNYDRNPHDEDPEGLLLDFRNNVIYNWSGNYAGYNADELSVTRMNYVGNFIIPGPNSDEDSVAYSTGSPFNRAYFSGNIFDFHQPENPWDIVEFDDDWPQQQISAYKQREPFETGPIHTDEAWNAFRYLLAFGGASLPLRDPVDARVVNSILQRSGKIIDSQEEVGGWPELKTLPAPQDTDQDGMPDTWELLHGLDPNNPEDRNGDRDGGGYTNLEAYLNELAGASVFTSR